MQNDPKVFLFLFLFFFSLSLPLSHLHSKPSIYLSVSYTPTNTTFPPLPKEKTQIFQPFISMKGFKKIYAQKMHEKFEQALEKNHHQKLLHLYRIGYLFQKYPNCYKENMIKKIVAQFCLVLKRSHVTLEDEQNLITVWKSLKPSQEQAITFLYDLNHLSVDLWALKKQYPKALALVHFLDSLSQDYFPEFRKEISKMLSSIVEYHFECNQIEALCYLYPLALKFDIHLPQNYKQEIHNHIADAEYLFKKGDREKAALLVKWILTIDPEQAAARKLYEKMNI